MAIALRPIEAADENFLFRLYAGTRLEELAPVPWTDQQKADFLRQQFTAQSSHYHTHYSGARFDVILRDGEPVGRLYVARWEAEIRIVDVAMLPAHRGAGIGTRLLRALLDEGAATARRVTIHVERANPAMRLYERLGFREVTDRGVYAMMEWSPAAPK